MMYPKPQRRVSTFGRLAYVPKPSPPVGRGTGRGQMALATSCSTPDPKTEPKRNRDLLDLAQGRRCLLMVPARCNWRMDTTVACHSNLSIHGKAGARKADDQYSVWGCAACHEWLDRSAAPKGQKEAVFMAAHLAQVLEWRQIASDQSEPIKNRLAAQWALDQLNATQVGEPA